MSERERRRFAVTDDEADEVLRHALQRGLDLRALKEGAAMTVGMIPSVGGEVRIDQAEWSSASPSEFSVYPIEVLGDVRGEVDIGGPNTAAVPGLKPKPSIPHIRCYQIAVPEGTLFKMECEHCGGRREAILVAHEAFRPNASADLKARVDRLRNGEKDTALTREISDFTVSQLEHGFDPLAQAFVAEHRDHTARIDAPDFDADPLIPDLVRQFVERSKTVVAKILAAGDEVRLMAHVLTDDNQYMMVPLDGISRDEKGWQLALRQASVRHLIFQRGWRVSAVAIVSEAWAVERTELDALVGAPSEQPDRKEIVMIAVTTDKVTRGFRADIHRTGGVVGEGPGTLGDWEQMQVAMTNRISDGWLALPLPHQTLRRDPDGATDG